MIKKLFQLLFFLILVLGFQKQAYAVDCVVPVTGGSLSQSCAFAGGLVAGEADGVDAGTGVTNTATLGVPNGIQLTVLSGQTVAVGSLSVANGGTINIVAGGQIKVNQPIYAVDADNDHYPLTRVKKTTLPTGGKRLNTLTSVSLIDCDDASVSIYPGVVNSTTWTGVCTRTGYNCTGTEAGTNYLCNGATGAYNGTSSTSRGCNVTNANVCRPSAGSCDANEYCNGLGSCPVEGYCPNNTVYSGGSCVASGYCSSGSVYCSGGRYVYQDRYRCNGSNSCTTNSYADTISDCGAVSYDCSNICTRRYNYTCSSAICGTYNSVSAYAGSNQICSGGSIITGWCGSITWGGYQCSGQAIQLQRFDWDCNGAGTCGSTPSWVTQTTCTGGENNRCVAGQSTCQNLCSNSLDDDGDGYIDGKDTNCGGCGQCTSGACCNTTTGCFQPNSTVCRNPVAMCDAIEYCSGSSASCPADGKLTGKQSCSYCEYCNGSSNTCTYVGVGTDPYNDCTASYLYCDGINRTGPDGNCNGSGLCNGLGLSSSCDDGNICKTDSCSNGVCTNTNNTVQCRASAGACDIAENCSGGSCPANVFQPTTYNPGGTCQKCTGSQAAPVNQLNSEDKWGQCAIGANGSATSCQSNNCSGNSAACGYLTAGTTCRTAVHSCDPAETCSGSVFTCLSDTNNGPVITVYRDADGDTYGNASVTSYYCTVGGSMPAGYVANSTDCDDTTNTKWRYLSSYTDTDGDGYGTGTVQSLCSGTWPPVGYSLCGPGTCMGHQSAITDCAPSDANNWDLVNLYRDADGDSYSLGTTTAVCMGGWYGVPAGYFEAATNPVDCYDSNANAKPGQCTYYSVHRGDGSFNYDCVDHPECSSSCPTECGAYQSGDRDFEIPWMGGCWGQCTSACGCTVDYSCGTCPGGAFKMTYAGWKDASAQPANYPICGQDNLYCNTQDCKVGCNLDCYYRFTKCK